MGQMIIPAQGHSHVYGHNLDRYVDQVVHISKSL